MPASYPAPVIFLPGIMGSALRDEYPVSPENVWSVAKAATQTYERITLHPDNLRFELVEPARVTQDQMFDLFYRDIVEELRHNLTLNPDEPVPVFPFAYDWRQPLDVTVRQLADFIEEVIERTSLLQHYHDDKYTSDTGTVSLVAHSMGGMIVAGYIAKNGMDRVERVATLATPFRGSLEAVAKTTIGVGGFTLLSGGSREREAARVTPALYHLLPAFPGAVDPAAGMPSDLFDAGTWQPGILETLATFVRRFGLKKEDPDAAAVRLLAGMLDQAETFHTLLEKLKLADPKRWLCVVGVHAKTRQKLAVVADRDGRPFFNLGDTIDEWDGEERTATGDGTVPYFGARCSFIPAEQIVCVTPDDFGPFEFRDKLLADLGFHSAIPNMNLVQRLVSSHLLLSRQGKLGGHPSPEIKPGDWDPPIAELAG